MESHLRQIEFQVVDELGDNKDLCPCLALYQNVAHLPAK